MHGTQLTGVLLGERLYFGELVRQNPLITALEPSSGLLGKEYVKDTETESGHHLHIRADEGRLWRISLETVDAWTLPVPADDARDDKGPFAASRAAPDGVRIIDTSADYSAQAPWSWPWVLAANERSHGLAVGESEGEPTARTAGDEGGDQPAARPPAA